MPAKRRYSQTISDYTTGVKIVRLYARKLAQHLDFSAEGVFGLELALDEAVTNAWEASPDPIKVLFILSTELLTICVLDRGKGLASGAKCSLNELEVNGRGCYLMQTYMDEVIWKPRKGGGMCCILKKQITSHQPFLCAITDLVL